MLKRCEWSLRDDLYINYHDTEWGVPLHDDRLIFEFLMLEGAQAGLSWHTVLKKRDAYRIAFDDFDPEKVARYDTDKIQELMGNTGIIRNQLKIKATVQNARAFLKVQEQFGSFDRFIWNFVEGKPIQNQYKTLAELPAETELSRLISKELKKKGFNFVGPTIVYAHMQATGMVNDHLVDCYRHRELS